MASREGHARDPDARAAYRAKRGDRIVRPGVVIGRISPGRDPRLVEVRALDAAPFGMSIPDNVIVDG